MAYTQLRSTLARLCPIWMQPDYSGSGNDQGIKYLYTPALLADVNIESVLQGVLAKLPGAGGTSEDLARIGRDRRIRRGYAETDAAYDQRLQRWRDDWKRAGNPYALMRQLQGYCYPYTPQIRIFNNFGTCYTLTAAGTNERTEGTAWDWDDRAGFSAYQARFWVVIYASGTAWSDEHAHTYGDGSKYGDAGFTWGSAMTSEQVTDLRNIVADWKAAHEICVSVILCFDDSAFIPETAGTLPDGTWGSPYKIVGGVSVASRNPNAVYFDGVTS